MFIQVLLVIRRFYERGGEKVVCADLEARESLLVTAAFNLYDEAFKTRCLSIVEDGVEADHSALSDFLRILDMEDLASSRILVEILDRTYMAIDSPVHIHLEKDEFRISVLEHVFHHYPILYLAELMRMVVIAELHS